MRQKGVTCDIKGHSQENIAASLIKLAGEFAVRHVELEKAVAGRKRHAVNVRNIPGADNDAAAVRMVLDEINGVCDLIDMAAVRRGPAAPLHAVDRA